MNLTAPQHEKNKLPIFLGIGAGLVVLIIGLAWYFLRPALTFGFDASTAPKFVKANFVDLNQYGGVSKFRSGAGHDFSGNGETCRSMKHYFMPKDAAGRIDDQAKIPASIDPATSLPAFSPVDGEVTNIQSEQYPLGKQFYIRPDGQESYTVRLFHVYPLDTIKVGSKVKAGERIGSLLPWQQTDVAVQVMTLGGPQLISYFNVMDDATLATYMDRGAGGANDFIISRDYRDTHPLTCNGEEFTDKDTTTADHWLFFSDFNPAL